MTVPQSPALASGRITRRGHSVEGKSPCKPTFLCVRDAELLDKSMWCAGRGQTRVHYLCCLDQCKFCCRSYQGMAHE